MGELPPGPGLEVVRVEPPSELISSQASSSSFGLLIGGAIKSSSPTLFIGGAIAALHLSCAFERSEMCRPRGTRGHQAWCELRVSLVS